MPEPIVFSKDEFAGIFISVCGFDGAGKTTLINRLVRELAMLGQDVVLTKQPTDEIRRSELFRAFVHSANGAEQFEYRSLSLLTVSDRVQHSMRVILPQLRLGKVVISDRYFFSAIANLRARGYRHDRWIYEIASYLPAPDLPCFLEPGFDLAVERVMGRNAEKNRFFDFDFNRTLYSEFEYVRAMTSDAVRLDSSQPVEDTYAVVRRHYNRVATAKNALPLPSQEVPCDETLCVDRGPSQG